MSKIDNLKDEVWKLKDSNNFIYVSNYGREKQRINIIIKDSKMLYDEILIFTNKEYINMKCNNEKWVYLNDKIQISDYGRIKKIIHYFLLNLIKRGIVLFL